MTMREDSVRTVLQSRVVVKHVARGMERCARN